MEAPRVCHWPPPPGGILTVFHQTGGQTSRFLPVQPQRLLLEPLENCLIRKPALRNPPPHWDPPNPRIPPSPCDELRGACF